MGSVVISDIVSDIGRFPHSMMVDDRHDPSAGSHQHSQQHRQHYSHSSSTGSSSARGSSRRVVEDGEAQPPRGVASGGSSSSSGGSNSSRQRSHSYQDAGYDRSGFPLTNAPADLTASATEAGSSPPSPQLLPTLRSSVSLNASASGSPTRIKVRDLNHIQAFASEEVLSRSRHGSRPSLRGRLDGGQQYEISDMPVTDIIEMVAGLLTRITTTNDRQHQNESFHQRQLPTSTENGSALSQQTASVLSFHGRNVPSITILSYLSRIHKYCPTTYEVFLSLLVYFDRMTEAINSGTLRSFRSVEEAFGHSSGEDRGDKSKKDEDMNAEADLVDSDDDEDDETPTAKNSHMFVVDSYNIHRLVIAGVTCASKFFSDVFYTNSRYAKVGGLPINELNHLELQFLLLNDFRLSVSVEELEAYGSMLVEFYAKEVVAQQLGSATAAASGTDALYMQDSEAKAQ